MKFTLHLIILTICSLVMSSCCSMGSSKVLARASSQASGEPSIGLIPTMKELSTSD
jgi:hypothetical protein